MDCRDNRGWNALHEAAAAGSKGCVQEILSAAGGKKGSYTTYDSSYHISVAVVFNSFSPG